MSAIEVTIKAEDDGGDVWLDVRRDDKSLFVILDSEAADLLSMILRHKRPGIYEFWPLDMNADS